MPLYSPNSNPAQMAQAAMSGATQAAAAQTKQTTTTVKHESNLWDDLYKGAAAVAAVGRGVEGLVGAVDGAWSLYDKSRLRSAYDDVSAAFKQGGFEAIQNDPDMQDYWHAQAVGQFVKDRAGTEQGRLDMLKRMEAVSDKLYQDWRVQAARAEDAYKAGNMQQFMPFMQQLSNITPGPHRLEATGDGNFKVLFRSDQHNGEFVETGQTLTPQQTMEMMRAIKNGESYILKGIDGKMHPTNPIFHAEAARKWWGTVMGNSENRLDPSKQRQLYDAAGRFAGIAILQNSHENYDQPGYFEVFDRRGKKVGTAQGVDGLLRMGFSPFAPQKTTRGSGGGDTRGGKPYTLSDGDRSVLGRYATRSDPETGEEHTDHAKAAFLENFMQRTGLSAHSAIAAYEANVQEAKKRDKNLSQVEAELAAQDLMWREWGGGPALPPPATAGAPQAGTDKPGTPGQTSRLDPQAAGAVSGVLQRMAEGQGRAPLQEGLAPSGELSAADRALAEWGGVQDGFARQRREARSEALKEDARRRAQLQRERRQLERERELADFAAHADRYGHGSGLGDFGEATERSRALERQRQAWGSPVFW